MSERVSRGPACAAALLLPSGRPIDTKPWGNAACGAAAINLPPAAFSDDTTFGGIPVGADGLPKGLLLLLRIPLAAAWPLPLSGPETAESGIAP